MERKIIYVAKCGCELDKSETYRKRTNVHENITACRVHHQKIIYRKNTCIDCGEWFTLNRKGPGGLRCKPCGKKEMARKRKAKGYNRGYRPPRKKKFSQHWRGDYCHGWSSCTTHDCDKCLKMTPIFKGVDPARLGQWR